MNVRPRVQDDDVSRCTESLLNLALLSRSTDMMARVLVSAAQSNICWVLMFGSSTEKGVEIGSLMPSLHELHSWNPYKRNNCLGCAQSQGLLYFTEGKASTHTKQEQQLRLRHHTMYDLKEDCDGMPCNGRLRRAVMECPVGKVHRNVPAVLHLWRWSVMVPPHGAHHLSGFINTPKYVCCAPPVALGSDGSATWRAPIIRLHQCTITQLPCSSGWGVAIALPAAHL
eukprot:832015-Pelagomonas_calceolata.AAC.1